MKENKRNIDEFFLSQLGNSTEQPSPALWDALEKRLDENNSSKKPRVIWWLVFLLVLVGAGAGLASYYGILNDNTQSTAIQETKDNRTAKTINNKVLNNNLLATEIDKDQELKNEKLADFVEEENSTPKLSNNTKIAANNKLAKTENDLSGRPLSSGLQKTKGNSNEFAVSGALNEEKDKLKSAKGTSKSSSTSGSLAVANTKSKSTKNSTTSIPEKESSDEPVSKKSAKAAIDKSKLANSKGIKETVPNSASENLSSELKKKTNKPTVSTTKNKTTENINNATKADVSKSQTKLANVPKKEASSGTNETEELKKNNQLNAARSAVSKEETIVFKPKKKTENKAPKTVSENRGLSGVPDDMKEEWEQEAAKNKDDEEFFSPAATNKETVKDKIKKQIEQVERIRAENPLSGVSLAANSMEEIPSENPNTVNNQNAGSGGGGATASAKDKKRNGLNMAIGVKAGYEQGIADYTAGKSVGSVFAEIRLSSRFGFIVQPTIKFARTNQQFTKQTGTYIDTGAISTNLYNTRLDTTGSPSGFYDFAYSQNYDSLVASSLTKNRFVEIEIPFLFRYKVNKNFSVLGGMNFVFGKIVGTENSLKRFTGGNLRDTIFNAFGTTAPSPPSKFSYTGSKFISNYTEPTNPLAPNPVRFGYTVGLSYAIREKLMIDFIVQQNLSGGNNISDADIKKLFTQPYFRLSIGYSILGKVGK